MPKRNYVINDPAFSEYVYHVLIGIPKTQILELSDKERLVFKNKLNIRRFADNETLDRRLLMLARLNIKFALVLADEGYNIDETLEQCVVDGISPEKRSKTIDRMAQGKMFVLSSKQYLMAAQMAADNSHSQLYVLNYEYAKLQTQVAMMQTDVYNVQQKKTEKAFDHLARFVLGTLLSDDVISSGAGVTHTEMKILLVLFKYRNQFVHADILNRECGEQMRSNISLKFAKSLRHNGYIDSLQGKSENEGRSWRFTILERGISAVMIYLKFIAARAKENR